MAGLSPRRDARRWRAAAPKQSSAWHRRLACRSAAAGFRTLSPGAHAMERGALERCWGTLE
eukprot:9503163-Pyramimonas_sp.AAC.1